MSEQLRESISAVMDGEANELELRRVLSEDNTEIVRSTWSRYHITKDILQGNDNELPFSRWDISSKVSEAIADEKIASKVVSKQPSWMRPVGGFAVAASVAFAVVVGVQSLNRPATGNAPGVVVATSNSIQSNTSSRVFPSQSSSPRASGNMLVGANFGNPSQAVALPGAKAVSKAAADAEAQKRLDKYILRHTERAALNNGKGMISYARVANFEAE